MRWLGFHNSFASNRTVALGTRLELLTKVILRQCGSAKENEPQRLPVGLINNNSSQNSSNHLINIKLCAFNYFFYSNKPAKFHPKRWPGTLTRTYVTLHITVFLTNFPRIIFSVSHPRRISNTSREQHDGLIDADPGKNMSFAIRMLQCKMLSFSVELSKMWE